MRPDCLPRSLALGLVFLFASSSPAAAPPESRSLVLQAPAEVSVTSLAVSPDGTIVAADSFDGRVRLHDARTGTLVRAIDAGGGRGVAFAPDGRTLACAGYHMDKLVGVYDVATGRRLRSLAGHTEWETQAVAFSPDGQLLASAGVDKQVLVWEVATGSLRHRLAQPAFPVTALAFSPDGAALATGGGDRTVRLWDVKTGRERRALQGHRDWVTTVSFSADGKTIASGCCDWAYHHGRNTAFFDGRDPGCQSEWKTWEVATGDCKRTVAAPGRLLSLAVSPDGKWLGCGVGKEVRLYDLSSDAPGRVVAGHDFDVTCVAFSRDGGAIFSGSHDHTVRRVTLATGKADWRSPGHYEQVNSISLSLDGSLLATGSSDHRFASRVLKAGDKALGPGAVRLWDARTGRLLRRLGDPAEQVMAAALSPDGRRVAAGGAGADGAGVVRAWDAQSGAPAWSKADHSAEVLAAAYSPDGATLATAGADGLVRLRDPGTGGVVRTLAGHEGGATSLAFSGDGALLVCGEGKGGTRLWEVRTGRALRAFKGAPKAAAVTTDRLITSVVFAPGGDAFYACPATMGNTYGEPVRRWDRRTGKLDGEFNEPTFGARPIALSPDGNTLAMGGKTVRLWDVRAGKQVRQLTGHLKKTQSMAFTADGRRVVAGGSYGTVNVWDAATGRLLVTLFAFPRDEGGTAGEDWLAYGPEGAYDGPAGVERYLAWRKGDDLLTPAPGGEDLRRPGRIAADLRPAD